MADRPNESVHDGAERRADPESAPVAEGGGIDPKLARPSARWVQLAYDLEQYGDPDPDERGEVF